MTVLPHQPASTFDEASSVTVQTRFDGLVHIVELSGELDVTSSATALRACTPPGLVDVIADLAGLRFMDCAGYGALVAATTTLDHRGGSLTIRNATAGPLRLLTLIDELGLAMTTSRPRGDPMASLIEPIAS